MVQYRAPIPSVSESHVIQQEADGAEIPPSQQLQGGMYSKQILLCCVQNLECKTTKLTGTWNILLSKTYCSKLSQIFAVYAIKDVTDTYLVSQIFRIKI